MFKFVKYSQKVVISFCVLFGCLGFTISAFGQLSLVSSTPADGATGVDTLATFVLVFNAPLDTTARFEEPQDFFLGIEIFPTDSVGEPEEIIVSSSLDTVTVKNVSLTPDTRFLAFLQGARSTTGQPLDRPYAMTFTTGSTLPTGSVSGTINFAGGDPGGTVVGLFIEPPFGAGDEEEDGGGELEAAAVVPLSSSNYTANYVTAGSYFVVAFKDVNQDGIFDFPEDAFGGYDADNDNIVDRITLAEGESLSDIDLTVSIPTAATARENFPTAKNIAQSFFADAELTLIGTDAISLEGEAPGWNYGFYSANQDTALIMALIGDIYFIMPAPLNTNGGNDDGPRLNIPLPENWIDSDVAVDSAEANGGSDFRNTYPDAQITAFASVLILSDTGATVLAKPARNLRRTEWSSATPFGKNLPYDFITEMVSDDTLAVWILFYFSDEAGRENVILLDVETGVPLGFPGPGGEPSTAATNLDAANQAASQWAADAALVIVGNVTTDLTPDGFAVGWGFAYYSAVKDSIRSFFLVSGMVTDEESGSKDEVPSLETLPEGWLDTPVVTPVAEANSNNFRNEHADAIVAAKLSRGLYEHDPSLAVWEFTYVSQADEAILIVHIDALTGDLITGINEGSKSASIPKSYALEQNYPNPFNPETVIEYQLPQKGQVELAVFNLLGQKVKLLVNELKKAGTYKVRWDGTDAFGKQVTSGVYFYRLQSGEYIQTNKMLLLR